MAEQKQTLEAKLGTGLEGKRILVVDDEPHIQRLVEVNLQKQGVYVDKAGDGVEAMEKIEASYKGNNPYDSVVLDIMMPRMTGSEVLERLRADPKTEELQVIMLTAKAQDKDIFEGWKSGADLYLTKPFNPMELVTFLKRMLNPLPEGEGEEKVYEV